MCEHDKEASPLFKPGYRGKRGASAVSVFPLATAPWRLSQCLTFKISKEPRCREVRELRKLKEPTSLLCVDERSPKSDQIKKGDRSVQVAKMWNYHRNVNAL